MKPEDLHAVYSLLPHSAQVLIDAIGATAALTLLNRLGGCEINIPKHPDKHPAGAQRWELLAEIIGEDAMQALAKRWGGDVLDIPICKDARRELRDRAIRAEFDRLTMKEGYSGRQAVYEITLKFCPITSRQVEVVCAKEDADAATAQGNLF